MIATASVVVAAALPLSGTTVHVDAGHNGANGTHATQINRRVPAGTGHYAKACDTTGAQTSDGRLTESGSRSTSRAACSAAWIAWPLTN